MKGFIIFMAFLTIAGPGWAGIVLSLSGDKAQLTRVILDIPEFFDRGDAIRFANSVGGSEPIRRKLKARMIWFLDLAHLEGTPKWEQIEMSKHYGRQHDFCDLALRIVNHLIDSGVPADKAMVVPDFNSRQDAVYWAQAQHESILELREAIRKRMLEVTAEYWRWHGNFRAGLMEAQMERLEAALKVVEDKAQVGAYFYAGSVPLGR